MSAREGAGDISSRTLVLIPSRLRSTRLPNKPLAIIAGEPMIVQVWRRAIEADVGPVVVACAEEQIAEAITAVGGRAILTDAALPSGTDRIFAALGELDSERQYQRIINLQGDFPTIDPSCLSAVLEPIDELGVDIGTLACATDDPRECLDPNIVKAVIAFTHEQMGRALYFTRATAPTGPGMLYHHIGMYAFTRDALNQFATLPPSPLEQREKLEQLRALEAGLSIGIRIIDSVPFGVDAPDSLERARSILNSTDTKT